MSERQTCIACSSPPVALVHDGSFRKPVCLDHNRLYIREGYTTTLTDTSLSASAREDHP